MARWISFILIVTVSMITIAESMVISAEPVSIMLDNYGNPAVMLLRGKRAAVYPYPQRTMMFTGYYRPVRRSSNRGQATGVFAQGNAVTGQAFFGGVPRLNDGPEPIEEPEVTSAEAQAAPAPEETYDDHRHRQDPLPPLQDEHHEPVQIPLTTEITQPEEKPVSPSTVSVTRPKVQRNKKTHKTPVTVDADSDDDEDETDEENDDEPIVPFVPFKSNKRRQGYPNLNNFFPMIFTLPRVATRAGSADSPPGIITAIANSYSTGKGGVASSVATAYGGSPTGKKRRTQPTVE